MHHTTRTCSLALALVLTPMLTPSWAWAGSSDQIPCRGAWQGVGVDPWNPDDPYRIELEITGGTQQCATVSYPGMCETRWVACVAKGNDFEAEEELVVPGTCIPAHVNVRCVDGETLTATWTAAPGKMEATLTRVQRPGPAPEPTPKSASQSESKSPSSARPRASEERGCGFASGFVVLPLLARRRRA